MASVQKTIMDAVRTAVLASPLSGRGYTSDNTRLRRRSMLDGMGDGKKCIVSQFPEQYIGDEATNEQDDIGYGVLITLAHAGNANPEYTDTFDDLIIDREALRKFFHNTPERITPTLPAGSFYYGLKVEPGPMLIAEHSKNNIDATALILRIFVRETHS